MYNMSIFVVLLGYDGTANVQNIYKQNCAYTSNIINNIM